MGGESGLTRRFSRECLLGGDAGDFMDEVIICFLIDFVTVFLVGWRKDAVAADDEFTATMACCSC